MSDINLSKKNHSIKHFFEWFLFSILIPSLPLIFVWYILKYLDNADIKVEAYIINILGRPELVFLATIAAITTIFDLILTVDSFKKNYIYIIIFSILLLTLIWAFLVYCYALKCDIVGILDKTRVSEFIKWSTIAPFIISFFSQIFLIIIGAKKNNG